MDAELIASHITPIEDIILRTGAIALAISALLGLLVMLVRFAILKPLEARLDKQSGGITAAFETRLSQMEKVSEERHAETVERYRHVEYELRANGGGSLKDDVRNLRKQVEALHDRVMADEYAERVWARALAQNLAAQNITIPNPDDYKEPV